MIQPLIQAPATSVHRLLHFLSNHPGVPGLLDPYLLTSWSCLLKSRSISQEFLDSPVEASVETLEEEESKAEVVLSNEVKEYIQDIDDEDEQEEELNDLEHLKHV